MASAFIFPTTIYGTPADVYGTAITQYANTPGGFPQGVGLQLGMFGVLFDRTVCRLLKTIDGVNPFDAVTFNPGNSNDYTVEQTDALNEYVVGANDRSGSTPLVPNNIAWFTTQGNAVVNCQGSLPAYTLMVSGLVAGQLTPYTPGTTNLANGTISGYSTQENIVLVNNTTSIGAYPVRIG